MPAQHIDQCKQQTYWLPKDGDPLPLWFAVEALRWREGYLRKGADGGGRPWKFKSTLNDVGRIICVSKLGWIIWLSRVELWSMVVTIQHAVQVFLRAVSFHHFRSWPSQGRRRLGGVFYAKKYYQNRIHSPFNASKVKMASSNTLNKNVLDMPDLANLIELIIYD